MGLSTRTATRTAPSSCSCYEITSPCGPATRRVRVKTEGTQLGTRKIRLSIISQQVIQQWAVLCQLSAVRLSCQLPAVSCQLSYVSLGDPGDIGTTVSQRS